ncbi:hypothetical protein SARC_07587, partial [Sphaeroforma arctica JP610]
CVERLFNVYNTEANLVCSDFEIYGYIHDFPPNKTTQTDRMALRRTCPQSMTVDIFLNQFKLTCIEFDCVPIVVTPVSVEGMTSKKKPQVNYMDVLMKSNSIFLPPYSTGSYSVNKYQNIVIDYLRSKEVGFVRQNYLGDPTIKNIAYVLNCIDGHQDKFSRTIGVDTIS